MKFLKLVGVLFGICAVFMVMPVLLWVLIPIAFICGDSILMTICEIYDDIKKRSIS